MNFDAELFLCAVGLAFIFEALPWILAPHAMRNYLLSLAQMPSSSLRIMGLVAMSLGLGVIWLARS